MSTNSVCIIQMEQQRVQKISVLDKPGSKRVADVVLTDFLDLMAIEILGSS